MPQPCSLPKKELCSTLCWWLSHDARMWQAAHEQGLPFMQQRSTSLSA